MHLLCCQDGGQPFGFFGAQSVDGPQVRFQHLTVEEQQSAEGLTSAPLGTRDSGWRQ